MSLLLANWKLIAIGLILAALGGYIFTITEERNIARAHLEEANAKLESIRVQSEGIEKAAKAYNAQVEVEHAKETQEIVNDYAKTVSAIHARDSGITCRVRVKPHSGSSPVSQTASSTQGIDATPPDSLVARLPQDAAITTAMLVGLQKFVREECTK